MAVAVLTIRFHLIGCSSLKEKRSLVKPMLARLHKEFNVSAAEVGSQDHWQEAVIACAMVSGDRIFLERALQEVLAFAGRMWPDLPVIDDQIEII
jgi:uncharacterized protein